MYQLHKAMVKLLSTTVNLAWSHDSSCSCVWSSREDDVTVVKPGRQKSALMDRSRWHYEWAPEVSEGGGDGSNPRWAKNHLVTAGSALPSCWRSGAQSIVTHFLGFDFIITPTTRYTASPLSFVDTLSLNYNHIGITKFATSYLWQLQ